MGSHPIRAGGCRVVPQLLFQALNVHTLILSTLALFWYLKSGGIPSILIDPVFNYCLVYVAAFKE